MFRNIFLIIRREYLQAVRSKAFVLSTVLLPIFMLAVTVLPSKLAMMKTGKRQRITIVVSDRAFGEALRKQFAEMPANDEAFGGNFEVAIDAQPTDQKNDSLMSDVRNGRIDGFLWATDQVLAKHHVTYNARQTSNFVALDELRSGLRMAWMKRRMAEHGFSSAQVDDLTERLTVDAFTIAATGATKSNGEQLFTTAIAMVMMLYVTLLVNGIGVMRSVVEEKQSRVLEVMLSSVTATELMAGKILGVATVGLTQMAVWATAGTLFIGPSAHGMMPNLPHGTFVFFAVFFLLGYLLYSTLYATLGAVVNSEQEAQQLQMFVTIPLIFCVVVMMYFIQHPAEPVAVVLSLVPFFAPILMFLRILVQPPPPWQVATAIGLLIGTTALLMVVCARIYRVGILMYGKRPTLPEILKWIKYA